MAKYTQGLYQSIIKSRVFQFLSHRLDTRLVTTFPSILTFPLIFFLFFLLLLLLLLLLTFLLCLIYLFFPLLAYYITLHTIC